MLSSIRILLKRVAIMSRRSPVSGASMKPTLIPSSAATSAKRFSRTVLPTPLKPKVM